MKKYTIIFVVSLFLFIITSKGFGQSFNIDLRNFEQINETEFAFDAYISNASEIPFTLFAYQFQFEFNQDILNGTDLSDSRRTWDDVSELNGVNRPDYPGPNSVGSLFTRVADNRLQFVSPQWDGNQVTR